VCNVAVVSAGASRGCGRGSVGDMAAWWRCRLHAAADIDGEDGGDGGFRGRGPNSASSTPLGAGRSATGGSCCGGGGGGVSGARACTMGCDSLSGGASSGDGDPSGDVLGCVCTVFAVASRAVCNRRASVCASKWLLMKEIKSLSPDVSGFCNQKSILCGKKKQHSLCYQLRTFKKKKKRWRTCAIESSAILRSQRFCRLVVHATSLVLRPSSPRFPV